MATFNEPVADLHDLKPGTEWHLIPGFSRYRISRTGDVAFQLYGKWRLKAGPQAQNGHRVIGLCEGGSSRSVNLHRLVAEVFLPLPSPDHKWVNFKDGDITHIVASNLEWTNVSPSRGRAKKTVLDPDKKTAIAQLLAEFPDETPLKERVASVARDNGLSISYVRHLVPGKIYKSRSRASPNYVPKDMHLPPTGSEEEWRQIRDAPGYDVSSWGRIRSWRCLEPTYLTPQPGTSGYLRIMLQHDTKGNLQTAVHRLVAKAFCQMPQGSSVVNHKDGDKTNNQLVES